MPLRRIYRTNAEKQAAYRRRRKVPVYFQSKTDQWATPLELFQSLDSEFGFETDVAALTDNAKCRHFYTPHQDGLKQQWQGCCWMNPPYGATIGQWVRKARHSAENGATVVCLLPARTDTQWWHDYVLPFAEVRFTRGRLKFGGSKHCAPFPSAVVIFRPDR